MKNADKELGAVLQSLEIGEATYHRWQNQYGGMKASEAKRLKELEDQNRKLKEIVNIIQKMARLPFQIFFLITPPLKLHPPLKGTQRE